MIELKKGHLSVQGEPPYDFVPTLQLARVILDLPPMPTPETHPYSIQEIFAQSNEAMLQRLISIMKMDDDLHGRLRALQRSYCGIAVPGAVTWPWPEDAKILEEIPIPAGYLKGLIVTTNGLRFLIVVKSPGEHQLMTPQEFQDTFGKSPKEHIAKAMRQQAQDVRRVGRLLDANPVSFEIQASNDQMEITTIQLTVLSRDEIEMYARRNHLTIMDKRELNKEEA